MLKLRLIVNILIVIMVLLIACDKSKNITGNNTIIYSISGKVFGFVNSEKIPLEGATLQFADTTIFTSSNGEYLIEGLRKGENQLLISKPEFASFDTTILVTSDTLIDFILLPLADYFPLKLGNRWEYQYYNDHFRPGFNHYKTFDGIKIWEIVEHKQEDSFNKYRIMDTFEGVELKPIQTSQGYIGRYDTVAVIIDTTFFEIWEDENYNLAAFGEPSRAFRLTHSPCAYLIDRDGCFCNCLDYLILRRKHSIKQEDIILQYVDKVGHPTWKGNGPVLEYIYLAKNIGVHHIYKPFTGPFHSSYTEYLNLINYTLY